MVAGDRDRRQWNRGGVRRAGWLVAALVAAAIVSCAAPAPVVQGDVVAEGSGVGRLAVRDELRPGDPPLSIDTSRAEIGAAPRPGDRVRIVYRVSGGVNYALAVMNLSRQAEPAHSSH